MKLVWSVFSISIICGLVACGNKGRIDFHEGGSEDDGQPLYRNAGFNVVSGSQALMVQSGQTPATGYHAKIQLNEQKGQKLTGGGYTAKIKYTTRTQ